MAIDYQLRSWLLSFSDVVAEVADRISPGNLLPQHRSELTKPMPQIVTNDVNDIGHYHIECGPTGYHQYRYRLVSWGARHQDAQRVDSVVKKHLDGFAGGMAGLDVGFTERLSSTTRFVPQLKLWRTISEYMIHATNGEN